MKKVFLLVILVVFLTSACKEINYDGLDYSCESDDDCAIAYEGSGCCNCPHVFSVKDIEEYKTIRFPGEKPGFIDRLKYSKIKCRNVMCKMCASIEKAVCVENRCRAEGRGIVHN